ncbi:hypothetical protein F4808DRAFT_465737 [Astrocystis sublimbata]|nr:hypothetical protein F4808DRAFT_465737 [Astrocystis sublimbata]
MQLQLGALVLITAAGAMRLPINESTALVKRSYCDDAVNNEPQYDCPKPEGHTLNPDGSCGTENEFDSNSYCSIYCEVKRTTFLGPKQNAPGDFGQLQGIGSVI